MNKNKKVYSKIVEKMVDDMTLFDDDLMSKVFDQNIPATKLLISTILNKNVDVIKSKGQWDMKNPIVNGRSITLDIFAKDSKGSHFNCEVQRSNAGAIPKRARFYSAMVDVRMLKEKQKFKEIKDSYVIFITQNDYFREGKPIYLIERKRENDKIFNDGNHIIYVNGQYKGNDNIGRLLEDFRRKETSGFNNPELEKGVRQFKIDKKGRQIMCEAVEKYAKEQYEIGISKGKDIGQKKGKKEGKIESIRALMNNLNFTAEQAMESLDIPKTEYSKYKSKL